MTDNIIMKDDLMVVLDKINDAIEVDFVTRALAIHNVNYT